ncbi:MAG: DUF504 domain-containing protein [Candidatus Heimdallarchaeota archaeon]|nr:DUF504 domain-containing protein [Candidatus Heimdallarchaeota archaeon]
MPKKGELKEWFSKIKFGLDNPQEFTIVFRDFDSYIELSFKEFEERRKTDSIPLHRISQIRKLGVPVFTRPEFCQRCGNPLVEGICPIHTTTTYDNKKNS